MLQHARILWYKIGSNRCSFRPLSRSLQNKFHCGWAQAPPLELPEVHCGWAQPPPLELPEAHCGWAQPPPLVVGSVDCGCRKAQPPIDVGEQTDCALSVCRDRRQQEVQCGDYEHHP